MEEINATVIAGAGEPSTDEGFVTRAEVETIVSRMLSSLRVSVSESDITRAQENARAMADNSEF